MSDEQERCPKCGAPETKRELRFQCGYNAELNVDSIGCLRRQLSQTQDQLQLALTLLAKLLRGLEWSGWDELLRVHICPVCGGYRSKKKHFPDCDLNKALSFLRGVGHE